MAFKLSGEVVALQLDNSTAKDSLCNQGGTPFPFLSRLTCYMLNVWHTYLPMSMWKLAIYHGESWFQSGTFFFCITLAQFQLCSQLEVDPLALAHTNQCQHYYSLANPLSPGTIIGPSGDIHFFFFCISFPSSAQVSVRTCLRSVSSISWWIEASWLVTVLNMLEDITYWCPII